MNNRNLNHGQSLIEVVVALMVVGLVAVALIRVSSLSLSNARYANEETEAVALAEKVMAELKASAVNDKLFWSTIPFPEPFDTEISNGYCYLVRVIDKKGELPTITTPRYSEANLAQTKVIVYWSLKSTNTTCSSEGVGAANYNHKIEVSTMLTK